MRSLRQSHVQDWTRWILTAIGEAWWAVKAKTLEQVAEWMVAKLTGSPSQSPRLKLPLPSLNFVKAQFVYTTTSLDIG
jgi:hypothetical protein